VTTNHRIDFGLVFAIHDDLRVDASLTLFLCLFYFLQDVSTAKATSNSSVKSDQQLLKRIANFSIVQA